MQSKISLFNLEIVKQLGRNVGWIGIVYLLALILILPMNILMTFTSNRPIGYIDGEGLLSYQFNFEFQLLFTGVIPILLAIFLFRFLHQKKFVDLVHSLPLKRSTIFHQYTLLGIFLLVIPVIVTALIVMALYFLLDLQSYFTLGDIFQWSAITIILNTIIFAIGVLIGIVTGISFIQGVLSYIILLFPVGVLVLLFFNVSYIVYGFPMEYLITEKIEVLSPLVYMVAFDRNSISWGTLYAYLLVAVFAYTLSLFLYKKRNLEMASQAIAFTRLKAIFKYGMTFCTMLLGGLYYGEIEGSMGWIIFGYVLGTLFGYYVAEMVLSKTWRVFTKVKGLVFYSISIIVLAFLTPIFFSAYENSIPDTDEIRGVQVSNYLINDRYYEDDSFIPTQMKEKESIQAVQQLHEELISNKKRFQKSAIDSETIFIEYSLANGEVLTRQYSVKKKDYEVALKAVYNLEEYKISNNEVFHIDENDVDKINFIPTGPVDKGATITDPQEILEFVQLVKEEILAEEYSSRSEYAVSSIDLMMNDKRSVFLELKVSYDQIENWLKKKDLLDEAMVTSEDIDYILVAKREELTFNIYELDNESMSDEMSKLSTTKKITNKKQIQDCLESIGRFEDTDPYIAAFHYENEKEMYDIKTFTKEDAPSFIK